MPIAVIVLLITSQMHNDPDMTLPEIPEGVVLPPMVKLKLLFDGESGLMPGVECRVSSTPAIVGRKFEGPGLRLIDPRVSRQHAKVWIRGKGKEVVCEDTSSNGTFVNGHRSPTAVLKDGDVVRVGNSFLVVRFEALKRADASIPELVGTSPSMAKVRKAIVMVAPNKASVLISGESGTGKEVVALSVHKHSKRTGRFVPVNCAAIPLSLAESQLFGHTVGSFTGAKDDHDGFFRMSQGGTIFLDEVGELPLELQPKLLRVLEAREVFPVGGTRPIAVDTRVVAATNKDLEQAVIQGQFRGDLYARLAQFSIATSPLRERPEDILPLFALRFGGKLPEISPALVDAMLLHPWPFNVRELFKVATELQIHDQDGSVLELAHVSHCFVRGPAPEPLHKDPEPSLRAPGVPPEIPREARSVERKAPPTREQVLQFLEMSQGNVSKLARLLGRSRRQVYRYLEKYGIDIDDNKE